MHETRTISSSLPQHKKASCSVKNSSQFHPNLSKFIPISNLGLLLISYPVCAFYIFFTECRHHYLCSTFYQMDTTRQDENNILTARGCHSSPESQGHLHIIGFYKVASYWLKFILHRFAQDRRGVQTCTSVSNLIRSAGEKAFRFYNKGFSDYYFLKRVFL